MSRPKFEYSRLFRPTIKQQQGNIAQLKEYERLGIRFAFSEKLPYTSDEAEAIKYISMNKSIPTDLEHRLLQTKEQRLNKARPTQVSYISDEEVLSTLV